VGEQVRGGGRRCRLVGHQPPPRLPVTATLEKATCSTSEVTATRNRRSSVPMTRSFSARVVEPEREVPELVPLADAGEVAVEGRA